MVNITLKYYTDTISIETSTDSFFCQLIDNPECNEIDFTDMNLCVSVKDFFCYFQGKQYDLYDLYNLINCMNFFQMLDSYMFLFDELKKPYGKRYYNNDISDLIMKYFGEYATMIMITEGLKLRYVGKIDGRDERITDDLLYRCMNCLKITELDASNNGNITNVNYMTSLVKLDAFGFNCGICNKGLKKVITLQELNAFNNPNITTVNHMTSLIKLDASYGSGINNKGLKKVITLQELNASYNRKITTATL